MSVAPSRRTFYKDIQDLYRTIESSTDSQACIEGFESTSVKIALRPKNGINAHAVFYMDVSKTSHFKFNHVKVSFEEIVF
ncbi:unnamed protein product [Hymenolepis diminuta]|uniref:Uncharacterized protein n=1 Tax=Hymenolepis diminuta TaxID=6216 RepID=A0A564Z7B3_HYMDI|nr:unnamed protein product [Hymenolepis diminuta]